MLLDKVRLVRNNHHRPIATPLEEFVSAAIMEARITD
jgi:hypothetical protein